MKKVILLTILLTSIFLYGCNNSVPSTQQNTNQPSVNNNQPTTPPATPDAQTSPTTSETTTSPAASTVETLPTESATQSIAIQGFAFKPSTITINAGTTVSWTNQDSAPHDIKSEIFASPLMTKGESFEYKFDTVGTYDYICGVHPSMKGQVIVK